MPTTVTREQERWTQIVNDPLLRDLPYKVETNARGQIVLSPHKNRHSKIQRALQQLFDQYAPAGEVFPEFAIATPQGVKVPDVIWTSPTREQEMSKTGDPSTLAPEICVEVLSESNTIEEMKEKRELYREVGAEEVWLVKPDGQIRFYRDEEIEHSKIAPDAPTRV